MRLLFITQDYPDPPAMGDRLIAYHLIRILGRRHEISLFSLAESASRCDLDGEFAHWCSSIDVEQVRRGKYRWVRYAGGLLSPDPHRYREMRSPAGIRRVAELARRGNIDLVHGIGLGVAEYMEAIPDVPKVATLIDCASLRQRQFYGASTAGLRKLHHLQNWWKLVRFERRHAPAMDVCVMVARRDAAAFRRSAGTRNVTVISNGVPLPCLDPGPRQRGLLVFSGVMDYWPNVDAVYYFAEQVLPKLGRMRPEVRLEIIGRNPERELVERMKRFPEVTVRGYVDDMAAEIRQAMIYVAPLRLGGGVKNKVLEAMATATPVIGTPAAFSGLRVSSGKEVLVCQSPDEFVRGIEALLDDTRLRETMGTNGRTYVEQHHSWEEIASRYEQIYARVSETSDGSKAEDSLCPLL